MRCGIKDVRRMAGLLGVGLVLVATPVPAAMSGPDAAEAYGEGRYQDVIKEAKGRSPSDRYGALYLGLSYLRTGDTLRAVDAWTNYTRLAPGSEGARMIAPYLTILRKDEARRRALAIREREGQGAPTGAASPALDPKRLVVAPFRNTGLRTADPLTKGLAALLILDLSKVPTVRVVDRAYTQAVVEELHFTVVDAVDETSAPRLGAALGAGNVVTGSIMGAEGERFLADAVVVQTQGGRIKTSTGLSTGAATFDRVEKALLKKILCGIGQCPERLDASVRAQIDTPHARSFAAFRLFSEGLEWLDRGQYREAGRSFAAAVREDPGFEAARSALRDTPIFSADIATMVATGETIPFIELAQYAPRRVAAPIGLPDTAASGAVLPVIGQQPITSVPVQIRIEIR